VSVQPFTWMQDAPGTDVHVRPQLQLPSVWHTQDQDLPSVHDKKMNSQLATYPPAIDR
jgi:hypothetical protein